MNDPRCSWTSNAFISQKEGKSKQFWTDWVEKWIREEHLSVDATMREFCHNMNRWIWNRNDTVTTLRTDRKVTRSLVFEPKLVFVSQPEHCYLSSGFSNSLLFELIPDGAGAVSSMERRKCVCMAIFTLEKDYSSETGYPLDNSRQIDKTSWFENMIRFLHQMETRQKIRAPYGIRTHDPPRSFVGSNPIWASDVFPSFCWCKKRIMFYFLFYWCCKKELVVHT